MAELDIRNSDVLEIDTIRFSNTDVIERASLDTDLFYITDSTDSTCLYIKDIPNLIKALQKAQELWSASE